MAENLNTENTETQDATQELAENETVLESQSEPSTPTVEDELLKLKAEYQELREKYLLLHADFENYRKRTIKEKLELTKTAAEDTIKAILPVIDDLDRALKNGSNGTVETVLEGVNLVQTKLHKTLEQKGLKAMESIGQPFNSEFQEAITQIPAPEGFAVGSVVDEIEKGYFLHEKTIRFAKVIIAS